MRLLKLAFILALPLMVQAAQGPALPETPFKFTKNVGTLPGGAVDIDPLSMSALDTQNGRMVGAVIRVSLKQGTPTPLGPQAFTFVNVIIANCNKNYVSLLAARAFGAHGNQLLTMTGVTNYPKSPDNNTPTDITHTFLCAQKITSTPIGGNTLPDSYKSFWK